MKTETSPKKEKGTGPFLQQLQAVLSLTGEGFIIVDLAYKVLFVNPAANKVLVRAYGVGCSQGESLADQLPPSRREDVLQYLKQAAGGTDLSMDRQILSSKDEQVWMNVSYHPLHDDDGVLTGISISIQDITHQRELALAEKRRKQAEQQELEAQKLFRLFMDHSPIAAWITDEATTLHYINPSYQRTFGFDASDTGKNLYDLFPEQLAVDYHMNNLRVLKEGKAVETLERATRADGTTGLYKILKFPLPFMGERMVAGWAVEVTEQEELKDMLTESIERYHYVNEATSDAIYDWDIQNRKIYRGPGFENIFGYTDNSSSIRTRLKQLHPDDLDRVRADFFNALRDPSCNNWVVEYRFRNASGEYRHVIDKAFIKRTDKGAVRVIGAMQDITQQKDLQQQLLEAEQKQKREIFRSIIEAQEKERRQLSVELHDNVNQILSSCKLMLEVACDNHANAAELTRKSYESLKTVITEIRKISHDLNPSTIQDIGLLDAINEMAENINLSGKMNVRVTCNAESFKHCMQVEDKVAVYRIIQEQLNNILKHAHASEVRIDLQLADKDNSRQVRLVIEDDGVGFDPAKVRKGLGFRNILHRVEYYHGSFHINTEHDKGCRMEVLLRLDEA